MSVRNYNWYALQATRRYPLDEGATGVDDAGQFIRDDILVDCSIRFPETLGQYAFVQGVTVTDRLVTIVIGAATAMENGEVTTIAALSVPAPVSVNVNYAVTALVPGVAGWAVLGKGVDEPFVGRYSTPSQTHILPRCAKPYRPLPIPAIKKEYLDSSLQGVVSIVAQPPLAATKEIVTVDGAQKEALVVRLVGDVTSGTNPLQTFLGPCAQRPESGTCPQPLISTINGVSPDCDGNIEIEFDGLSALTFEDCGGIDVIASLGLAAACNAGFTRGRQLNDTCNPTTSVAAFMLSPGLDVPLPPPDIVSSISLPCDDISETHAALPVCCTFKNGTEANDTFIVKDGLFVYKQLNTRPAACGTFGAGYVYSAANVVGRNIALYRHGASDWAVGTTMTAQLLIGTSGLERNGGLVFNYLPGNPYTKTPPTYLVALLDVIHGQLRLLRYNGVSFVLEYATPFRVIPNQWYTISVSPRITQRGSAVHVTAASVDGTVPVTSFSITIEQYGEPTGLAGFFSNQSFTHFNSFSIERVES